MSSSLRLLCAACVLTGVLPPALAAGTIPAQPLRAAPPPAAPKPWTVGARFDSQGFGIAGAYAIGPSASIGLYRTSGTEKELRNDGSDPISVTALGIEARYYWGGKGLKGKYILADLAKIDSEFERSASAVGRTSGEVESGTKPGIGVGYRFGGEPFSADIGVGLRGKLRYTATYGGGGRSEMEESGSLYVGASLAF